MSIKKVYPLTTPAEIRTALRKRTVQNSIWKDQAKSGVDCREELFAYIDLMSEDECKEFLNSVREAPFIPDMGLMWTEEVANYLMFGDLPSNMRYSMDRCATFGEYVQRSTRIEPIPYRTDYVKKCVDKRYWCLLPLGGTANYYSPSQVLRLAIIFHHSSELAEYIAEAFFIKAADLEDCLKPTVKVPKPLPIKPRQRKTPQKKVVLQVPESACVSIDVPKPAEPKVPKQRRNPVVTAVPVFSAGIEQQEREMIRVRQAEGIVAAKAKGTHCGRPFVKAPDNLNEIMRQWAEGAITAVKAMELTGLKRSTFYKYAREFRANMAAATT